MYTQKEMEDQEHEWQLVVERLKKGHQEELQGIADKFTEREKTKRKEHMIELHIMYKELKWERIKVTALAGMVCVITIAAVVIS